MDALLWHRQALTPLLPTPHPHSEGELAAMSAQARTTYAREVRAALRGQSIRSPIHEQVRASLTQTLDSALLEPHGARTILALSAPYAVGKSTMVKRWAQGLYRGWVDTTDPTRQPRAVRRPGFIHDVVPICYLSLLSNTKSKDLYAQLLAFIGYPVTGSEASLVLRTIDAIRDHGVKLVILDDAHMLRTSSVTGRSTLNAVKHLNTELGEVGAVLVLVGADITHGEALADPQIRGRLIEHTLAPYEIDTISGRTAWQHFLDECEDVLLPYLPGNEPGLFSTQNAAYLWQRTQGYVGDVVRILVEATAEAISARRALDRHFLDAQVPSQRAQDAHMQALRQQSKAQQPGRQRGVG